VRNGEVTKIYQREGKYPGENKKRKLTESVISCVELASKTQY
jgi:hypothetical protein